MATDDETEKLKNDSVGKNGGARPGAGRKKGGKNASSLAKDAALRAFRERVVNAADRLFNAQVSLATGTQMLFVVHTDSKGVRRKPEIVTDIHTITRFLDENEGEDGVMDNQYAEDSKAEDYYFLTTTPPNNQALQSLLDRAFGKAVQNIDLDPEDKMLPGSFVGYVIPGIISDGPDTEE